MDFLIKNVSVFYMLATVGFFTSLIVHLSSFFGYWATMEKFWFLHVGVFVVWFPAVILSNENKMWSTDNKIMVGMDRSPKWLSITCAILFCYALINFAIFMGAMGGGGPEIENGKYVLSSHGKFIKDITETEYWHLKAMELRGFSGHWMFFYLTAASILLTPKKIISK